MIPSIFAAAEGTNWRDRAADTSSFLKPQPQLVSAHRRPIGSPPFASPDQNGQVEFAPDSPLERIGFEPSVSATDDAVEIVVFSYSAFLVRPEKQQLVHKEGTSDSHPICSANRWLLVMRSGWDLRRPAVVPELFKTADP